MPAKKPPPISPEGRRAAERIRTIFYSIAAANLVLVAIVMWRRNHGQPKPEAAPVKPAAATK